MYVIGAVSNIQSHIYSHIHMYCQCIHIIFTFCRFNSPQNGLSLPVAFMGAPTIEIEKLISGTEMPSALEGMKKLLVSGVCEKSNDLGKKSSGGLEVKQSTKYPGVYEAFGLDKIQLPQDDSEVPVVWHCCVLFYLFC